MPINQILKQNYTIKMPKSNLFLRRLNHITYCCGFWGYSQRFPAMRSGGIWITGSHFSYNNKSILIQYCWCVYNINRATEWHNLNNRGCNPRSTINWMTQPWRGWILDWYWVHYSTPRRAGQALRGCQRVFLSLPWVAPTVIHIKPLRGKHASSL